MNPDDYKNTKTYYHTSLPEAKERYERIIKEINETPLKAYDRESKLQDAKSEHKLWIAAQNIPYYAEEKRIHDQFRADMEAEHMDSSWPEHVKNAIHSYAWEQGHSGGFSEVHNYYYDIVDFVRKIMIGATWIQ